MRSFVRIDIAPIILTVAYSDPTPKKATNLNDVQVPAWSATKRYPLDYLRIGNKDDEFGPLITMESGFLEERIAFWRNLQAHARAEDLTRSYIERNEL